MTFPNTISTRLSSTPTPSTGQVCLPGFHAVNIHSTNPNAYFSLPTRHVDTISWTRIQLSLVSSCHNHHPRINKKQSASMD
ncbi:hypothetical protein KIN20_038233 [Parelaphostrongylus tenuis]|uniref:Uncharacterized protein n=1 Tax=Parelaphostrongylus tenuis TaxID=148309 RepID=A0AAD5REJ7_PARTN|nr:hypothetical protein KIN20_038233 [Parelaphostrongylus tenuis]